MKKSLHIPVVPRHRAVIATWSAMVTSSWVIMVGHLGEIGYPMMGADLAYTGYLVWRHNFHNGEPLTIGKTTPKAMGTKREPAMWPPVSTHCYVCGMEDVGGKRMEVFKTANHPSCLEWLGVRTAPVWQLWERYAKEPGMTLDGTIPAEQIKTDFGSSLYDFATRGGEMVEFPKPKSGGDPNALRYFTNRDAPVAPPWLVYRKGIAEKVWLTVDGVRTYEHAPPAATLPGTCERANIIKAYGGNIGYSYAQRGTEIIRLDDPPKWLATQPEEPPKGIVAGAERRHVKSCACRDCLRALAAERRESAENLKELRAAVAKGEKFRQELQAKFMEAFKGNGLPFFLPDANLEKKRKE